MPNYFSLLTKKVGGSDPALQKMQTQRHQDNKKISFYHGGNSSISEEDSIKSSPVRSKEEQIPHVYLTSPNEEQKVGERGRSNLMLSLKSILATESLKSSSGSSDQFERKEEGENPFTPIRDVEGSPEVVTSQLSKLICTDEKEPHDVEPGSPNSGILNVNISNYGKGTNKTIGFLNNNITDFSFQKRSSIISNDSMIRKTQTFWKSKFD